jgi:uncharacterized protein YbcC (UPF0753/DUF2309 family)
MLKKTETMSDLAPLPAESIAEAVDTAIRSIPPAWPLAATVAVNPFLGQSNAPLECAAARLHRVGGVRVTMPRAWFKAKLDDGTVTDADLSAAIEAMALGASIDVAALKAAAAEPRQPARALPTLLSLASAATGTAYSDLYTERLGHWAAGYFDAGQALWAAPRGRSAYASWRASAMYDLTPEIAGLSGFGAFVADAPDSSSAAIDWVISELDLIPEACSSYFHQLLFETEGWGQYGRYLLWQAELAGQTDATCHDLLAIRLIWELAVYRRHAAEIACQWQGACEEHARPITPSTGDRIDACLQLAAEIANQRKLAGLLGAQAQPPKADRPALQAAFCIDVRSEVFRRALEAQSPDIQTIGFAGFFGIATAHAAFASDVAELRLPVLLNPGLKSCTAQKTAETSANEARWTARAKRAWGRFKLAAVSSFAFVEASGPVYAGELVRDALGLHGDADGHGPQPVLATELTDTQKTDAAETVLRAMSLTGPFARLVLLAGHGASVVNNPHQSALQCGACGGYSGDVNARLLAALLNDPAVRDGLKERGIDIPADTHFVAALHDTTSDTVTLFDRDQPSPKHLAVLETTRTWLAEAKRATNMERALKLPRADDATTVDQRAHDWAEVRPEWALAGCEAFIAAPRKRTAGTALGGRAFLHDYDWTRDEGFSILELILTAPVVVASWISLQYYGSAVAPRTFGAGNKLLHNVTGGIGVVEGNGGALRTGLPWQSVHDGEKLMHDPLRLTVFVEAPTDAITDILNRHPEVRALFDNRWLHLIALTDGAPDRRYCGGLEWSQM